MTNKEAFREIQKGDWREKFARKVFRDAYDLRANEEGDPPMEDWGMEILWNSYLFQLETGEPKPNTAWEQLRKAFEQGFKASEEKKNFYDAWEIYDKQLEEN